MSVSESEPSAVPLSNEDQPGREPDEEDDSEDPLDLLRDKCRQENKPLVQKLLDCNDRVDSKEHTTETCVDELFELMHAVDKCVAKDLFDKLV